MFRTRLESLRARCGERALFQTGACVPPRSASVPASVAGCLRALRYAPSRKAWAARARVFGWVPGCVPGCSPRRVFVGCRRTCQGVSLRARTRLCCRQIDWVALLHTTGHWILRLKKNPKLCETRFTTFQNCFLSSCFPSPAQDCKHPRGASGR